MQKHILNAVKLSCGIFTRFIMRGGIYYAAGLALITLLSLVPLIVVSLAAFAVFPGFAARQQVIQDFIFRNFVPTSGQLLEQYLTSFVMHSQQLSLLGLVSLLISAILLLANVEQAFNHMWQVKRQRRGLKAFFVYWSIITLSPLLLGLSFAISSYVLSLPFVSDSFHVTGIMPIFLAIVPSVLAALVFTLLYRVVPNCTVPWHSALCSGIITAALFELAKYGFAVYLNAFSTYEVIYGTLAIIPIFIFWIYFSWLIVLFGAALSHGLSYPLNYLNSYKLDGFSHAYLWLGYFWQAQQEKKGLSISQLVSRDQMGYQIDPAHQIEQLLKLKFIRRLDNHKYFLSVNMNDVSFYDLTAQLPWKMPSKLSNDFDQPWLRSLGKKLQTVSEFVISQETHLVDLYQQN